MKSELFETIFTGMQLVNLVFTYLFVLFVEESGTKIERYRES